MALKPISPYTLIPYEDLIQLLPDLPIRDRNLVKHAYDFAQEAHKGQKRMSGEDHFVHCVEVARLLAEMKLDAPTIAAGLLHDVVEDTPVTVEQLQ